MFKAQLRASPYTVTSLRALHKLKPEECQQCKSSILPAMMGARRKISESRLLTGSYGEYSSKSLPAWEINGCKQYVLEIVGVYTCKHVYDVGGCYLMHYNMMISIIPKRQMDHPCLLLMLEHVSAHCVPYLYVKILSCNHTIEHNEG